MVGGVIDGLGGCRVGWYGVWISTEYLARAKGWNELSGQWG